MLLGNKSPRLTVSTIPSCCTNAPFVCGRTKLRQPLAATATWRAQIRFQSKHCNFGNLTAAIHDHVGDGRCFRTPTFGVGGIFDVAAAEDTPIIGKQCNANGKFRIRRMGLWVQLPAPFYADLLPSIVPLYRVTPPAFGGMALPMKPASRMTVKI